MVVVTSNCALLKKVLITLIFVTKSAQPTTRLQLSSQATEDTW